MARQYDAMNAAAEELWRVEPRDSVINRLLEIYHPHAEAVAAKFSGQYRWFSHDEFLGAAVEKQWRLARRFDPDKGTQFTSLCHNSLQYACLDLLRSNLGMSSKLKAQMEAKNAFVTTMLLSPQDLAASFAEFEAPDNGEGARQADAADAETAELLEQIDPEAASVLRTAMTVDCNVDQLAKVIGVPPMTALSMLEAAVRHARYGERYAPTPVTVRPKKIKKRGKRTAPEKRKAA